ncbi:MAG: hypothetical protein OEW68_07795 [Gammaproteobacteria bacterium]|nr:hypothetical protein [Gammaproteobacteria bacterium]MDH4314727.1 hypothetical protein [Gammaproteobacteria bacterium]MDH5212745.1 hypothetical protein [Gammaproteobacteria bacterium]MDH5502208.1 hypothetical protein [Gammaproteobacteria bacterium]
MNTPKRISWNWLSFVIGALAIALLAACGGLPPISTSVDFCCKAPQPDLKTFRVEFDDMPEFLKPMLRDEAAIVLHDKGVEYTEGDAHAILKMTYVHNPLPEDMLARPHDSFSGTQAPSHTNRFMAEVKVELRDAVSQELLWSGTMVRAHYVQMGAYMHDAPARTAMRQAFYVMFADYPTGEQ